MIYRYNEFRDWIHRVRGNHQVWRLCDYPMNGEKGVILRHDVDLDVFAAYRLAEIELECGVRSSCFFLLGCSTYNLLAANNQKMLRQMADWGFDVGLHFDPMLYGDAAPTELQQHCQDEANILANITGQPVRSVSIHCPSVHGQYPLFDGFVNAYDPRVFTSETYLSDSRMKFRHNPNEFIDRASHGPVQILLHPMHYSDDGARYDGLVGEFIGRFVDDVDEAFRANEGYRSTLPSTLRSHLSRSWSEAAIRRNHVA